MDSEVEELKTEQELIDKRKFLAENRFAPNKIRYQGSIYYIRHCDGKALHSLKTKIVEDYFHEGCYIEANSYYLLNHLVTTTNTHKVFDPKDEMTFVKISIERLISKGQYAETSDEEIMNKLTKKLITKYYGETKDIHETDEYMESLGFVRGKVNENYWFHKNEIKHLDSMLPYKKFDNTVCKQDIKQLQKSLSLMGHPQDYVNDQVSLAIKNNIKYGTDSLTFSAFEGLRYSFGCEIETSIGRLDFKDYQDLNIKAVHDGSLRDAAGNTPGGEYVSGVLIGDAGLVQLDNICRALANKCKVNNQCGVHVHAGSLNWNKEDICYSYILAEQLENEIFNILPKSRRNNSYCRRLTQLTLDFLPELRTSRGNTGYDIIIDRIYEKIFKEVTFIKGKNDSNSFAHEGMEENFSSNSMNNRNRNHPSGSKCGYDKNAQRYCWLNFVTLLYNTKVVPNSQTLEIRNHGATMNFIKIKNWIKIFFAMIRFVEMNKSKIRRGKVTLNEVVKAAYPKTGDKLIEYIDERRELFKIQGESIDYEESTESKLKKTIKEVVTS